MRVWVSLHTHIQCKRVGYKSLLGSGPSGATLKLKPPLFLCGSWLRLFEEIEPTDASFPHPVQCRADPHPSQHTRPRVLAQPDVLEIVLDDHVRDSVEHKLDVAGVSGTGEVGIDLLGLLVAVEVLELPLYIDGGLLVGVLTLVVGEAHRQRNALDLLRQQVLLVEEEDERRVGEPVVVADGVKEAQTLCHAALWRKTGRRLKTGAARVQAQVVQPCSNLNNHVVLII